MLHLSEPPFHGMVQKASMRCRKGCAVAGAADDHDK